MLVRVGSVVSQEWKTSSGSLRRRGVWGALIYGEPLGALDERSGEASYGVCDCHGVGSPACHLSTRLWFSGPVVRELSNPMAAEGSSTVTLVCFVSILMGVNAGIVAHVWRGRW